MGKEDSLLLFSFLPGFLSSKNTREYNILASFWADGVDAGVLTATVVLQALVHIHASLGEFVQDEAFTAAALVRSWSFII